MSKATHPITTPVFQTGRLPNGLRLLTVPLHETKAVTVLVFTKVGSRYESPKLNGVSHFVEHLMFKGTERRPNTLAISRLLDGVGAEFNAFTSKDHTGYYIKINSAHLDLALDVLSDMLWHSKFDPAEIDRERNVIVEEISMYEDNPLMYIEDVLEQTLYDGNPLGQLIAGPRDVIRTVSRDAILGFVGRHYYPANMIVAVAGHFDEAAIKAKITGAFGTVRKRPTPSVFPRFRYHGTAPRVKVLYRETEQAQIGLGFPALGYADPKLPALLLLTTILGGNMSSRLFVSIREKRGLAYAIKCASSIYEDTGNVYVQAGVASARAEESVRAILDELRKVAARGVTAVELNRAKEFLKGKIVLELEDSESIAAWFGRQWLLTGKLETPAEKMAKFSKVTRAEILSLAKTLFRNDRASLAIIGPYKDAGIFQKVLTKPKNPKS